ncbi:MAG: aspartate aminotransferase family protein [Pseudorhodoplanes sp.]
MRRLENPGLRTFADPEPIVLSRASGSWLEDVNGKRFLDLSGLYAVSIIGHGHPKVVEAVKDQAEKLIHCPSAYPSETRAEFLEMVESIVPKGLDSILPAMTGAMANEMAVSMAHVRRPRGRIISFSGSYFGRSTGIVGLAGKVNYRDNLGIDTNAQFMPFPNLLTMGPDATDQVMNVLKVLAGKAGGLGEIAAVILEPIQGNGGVLIPPPDFLPRIRAFCDETGALLITDEIQSGNGRTGTMWAAEQWGVTPDILTMGKGIGGGMAVAAVATRKELVNWAADSYSSTFLTNNVNLAAGIAAMGVMKSEKLAARAKAVGPKFLNRMKQQLSGLPGVAEVRGIGMWYATELVDKQGAPDGKSASRILQQLKRQGIIAGGGGYSGNVVKLAPALNIDEKDLSDGVDATIAAIKASSAAL